MDHVSAFRNALVSMVTNSTLDFQICVDAGLCLAHLCMKSDETKQLLLQTLNHHDEDLKAKVFKLNLQHIYIGINCKSISILFDILTNKHLSPINPEFVYLNGTFHGY